MPPVLALILWFILLLALFRFDPAKEPGTSFALWIPLIWLFIAGSRLPSQWLGFTSGVAAQALQEGNPLDRAIFSLLIVMSIVLLTQRSFNWGGFVSHNVALVAFLAFTLASVFWSDFPFITFKRWFRDLGNYFVILVVLSDSRPFEALRTLLRRLCYLLIPLSVLLVKYFPEMAKQYNVWSGIGMFSGAATSKNMLGNVCMISGIFFFWDTLTRWSARNEGRNKWIIRVNLCFLLMTLWLLNLSRSATSGVCMAIGCLVVALMYSQWGHRHTSFIKVMVPVTFCLYLILAFGFDLAGNLAQVVGRDPTLTDRTLIWETVLDQHTNPVVGTGYETFWLGTRLERIWSVVGFVNEAHNGYLDIYLNLGIIGVVLLALLLLASYRRICQKFKSSYSVASLSLAMWTVILFYNITEAAFKTGPLWLILLMSGVSISRRAVEENVADAARPTRAGRPAMGRDPGRNRLAEFRLQAAKRLR